MATASSDHTCRVWELPADPASAGGPRPVAVLAGAADPVTGAAGATHDGPVWRCAWAHPRFGALVATCGLDHRVCVWRGPPGGDGPGWDRVWRSGPGYHGAGVVGLSFAPERWGLGIASGDAAGHVRVAVHRGGASDGAGADASGGEAGPARWDVEAVPGDGSGAAGAPAHPGGCLAVSFSPDFGPDPGADAASAAAAPPLRLATAGADRAVRIWRRRAALAGFDDASGGAVTAPCPASAPGVWESDGPPLRGPHRGWVRDVAWCPAPGAARAAVASCSDDGVAVVWTETGGNGGSGEATWTAEPLSRRCPQTGAPEPLGGACWSVAWSTSGDLLAVTHDIAMEGDADAAGAAAAAAGAASGVAPGAAAPGARSGRRTSLFALGVGGGWEHTGTQDCQ